MFFNAKKKQGKVFVGLSGGVDSAVSAALLKKALWDVECVFIRIALHGYPCTASADRQDALRVVAHLELPFREIDLSEAYRARVFEHTISSYRRGETPNPDTLCNREIKFGLLYEYAMKEGAQFVATGHYAQTEQVGGRTHLRMSADKEKDQSYFLWMVPEDRLQKTLFPVGGMQKSDVRRLAEQFSLPNARRKDSQGLCFLGDISINEMLKKELGTAQGAVLDEVGRVIGEHHGAALYTIGERHGFTVNSKDTKREPRYVIAKDMQKNTITVSSKLRPKTASEEPLINLAEENWTGEVNSGTYAARFRYRQTLIPADLIRTDDRPTARLKEPRFVPSGQSLVFYQKERCLGGGVISSK